MKLALAILLGIWCGLASGSATVCSERNVTTAKVLEGRTRCRKACDSDVDCRGESKRCLCDGHCGKTCYNPDSECAPISSSLDNGYVSVSARIVGSKANYTCHIGFKLIGKAIRTCHSDRRWSWEQPKCIDHNKCETPVYNTNKVKISHKKIFWNNKESVTFTCKYRSDSLRGNRKIKCLNGKWSDISPDCIYVNPCHRSPCFNNGKCVADEHNRNTFSCLCNDQYFTGKTCKKKKYCTFPSGLNADIEVIELGSENFRGARVWPPNIKLEIQCKNPNAKLNVQTYAICKNGNWTQLSYTCGVHCPKPTIDNGHITDEVFLPGKSYRYSCTKGFDSPDYEIHCRENGEWHKYDQYCYPITCDDDPNLRQHMFMSNSGESYHVGTSATLQCDEPYVGRGDNAITCLADRTWTDILFECYIPDHCSRPASPPHVNFTNVKDRFEFDEEMKVECIEGYELVPGTPLYSITCTEGGVWRVTYHEDIKWTSEYDACSERRCYISSFQIPVNMVIDGSTFGKYKHGDRVKLSCENNPQFNEEMWCDKGHWVERSYEDYTCEVTCDVPPTPPNVRKFGKKNSNVTSYAIGTELRIKCNIGYYLKPGLLYSINCSDDGTWKVTNLYEDWSDEYGACLSDVHIGIQETTNPQEIDESPVTPIFGQTEHYLTTQETKMHMTIEVPSNVSDIIPPDYTVETNEPEYNYEYYSEISPSGNSVASTAVPTKETDHCRRPASPSHVIFTDVKDRYEFDEKIQVKCIEGYELVPGTSLYSITCTEGGVWRVTYNETIKWTSDFYACVERHCTINPWLIPSKMDIEGAHDSLTKHKHGTSVTLSCANNPHFDEQLTCDKGKWIEKSYEDFVCEEPIPAEFVSGDTPTTLIPMETSLYTDVEEEYGHPRFLEVL